MSDQLLGVIVGAVIGFAGTYLIARLEREADKERRREERRWQYRRKQVERIRAHWEQTSRLSWGCIVFSKQFLELLGRIGAVPGREVSEELLQELKGLRGQADKLYVEMSEAYEQLWRVLAIHDPELGPAVRLRVAEAFSSVGGICGVMESLEPEALADDKMAGLEKELKQYERTIIESIRQVENSMERYVTRFG